MEKHIAEMFGINRCGKVIEGQYNEVLLYEFFYVAILLEI